MTVSTLTPPERKLLEQFACCDITTEDLLAGMHGKLTLNVSPGQRRVICNFGMPLVTVPFSLAQIQHARHLHRQGRLSSDELGLWAALILMIDAYDWADTSDEDAIAEDLNDLALNGLTPATLPDSQAP